MLLKKKLCIAALLGGILFFMIASHTIQKNSLEMDTSVHSSTRVTQTKTVSDTSLHRSCGCSTCIKDPGISEWFDQRFDFKQQPYLIGEENQIDPVSLKWWKVSFFVKCSLSVSCFFPMYSLCTVILNLL